MRKGKTGLNFIIGKLVTRFLEAMWGEIPRIYLLMIREVVVDIEIRVEVRI